MIVLARSAITKNGSLGDTHLTDGVFPLRGIVFNCNKSP